MLYVSGIQALNLPCALDTDGDWHQSGIRWDKLALKDSKASLWGDYGIEKGKKIPGRIRRYNVANHIRALLDLLADNKFSSAQGIRDQYINNDGYTKEIFDKIWLMRNLPNWRNVDSFVGKEYMRQWIEYKRERSQFE